MMVTMANPTPRRRPLLTREEADQLDLDIMRLAVDEGRRLASKPNRLTSKSPDKPDITWSLSADLREQLESEVVIATKPDDAGRINGSEFKKEISKRALVGLKTAKLKEIARFRNLPVSGGVEDLATRIAASYGWDDSEIATAIALSEKDQQDRGFVSRLFCLREPIDQDRFAEKLVPLAGRYVKVGIARWIVFGAAERGETTLALPGSFKSYRARVDTNSIVPEIQPIPTEQEFTVLIGGRRILRLLQGGQIAAKLATTALSDTVGLDTLPYVPNAGSGAPGIRGTVHGATEFCLDLIHTRLRDVGFDDFDLTVIKFDLPDGENPSVAARRPSLRAVRFEGAHLLDSVDSCKLIALDGRPLVDFAFTAVLRVGPDDELRRFAMRVAIEGDHVQIHTAFGLHEPVLAQQAHSALQKAVSDEIDYGVKNSARLTELISKIRDRSTDAKAPEEANILIEDEEREPAAADI
jgi:hypothetical protein